MKEDITNKTRIVQQYLAGRFSEETESNVQRWIAEHHDDTETEAASLDYFNSLKAERTPDTRKALQRVNARIGFGKERVLLTRKHLYRIAAILLLVLSVGGGYTYYNHSTVTVSVAHGQEKHITLPDDTEVWLNAGSTLKYPRRFSKSSRTVQLDGEGYFSVKPTDARSSFIVHTEKLSVKVLGTKFNVKAYRDDDRTTTTLTSGKVEVQMDKNTMRILDPNQQLTYNSKTKVVNIVEVPAEETRSWLDDQLIFTDAPAEEIFATIERKFNVTIHVPDGLVEPGEVFTVKFIRNDRLNNILGILGDMIGFGYHTEGNTITLSK